MEKSVTTKKYRKATNAEAHAAVKQMQTLRNLVQAALVDAEHMAMAEYVCKLMDEYLWKEAENTETEEPK